MIVDYLGDVDRKSMRESHAISDVANKLSDIRGCTKELSKDAHSISQSESTAVCRHFSKDGIYKCLSD